MFNDFIKKRQFGRYVKGRTKDILAHYQLVKTPNTSNEDVYKILIANSIEILRSFGFIDGQTQEIDTYVESLLIDTKNFCNTHNKSFGLQAVSSAIISSEAGFMVAENAWAEPKIISKIIVRNVSSIIPQNL